MEATAKTMKTEFGISQLETNFNTTVKMINNVLKQNDYVLIVNGTEVPELNIHHYFDFGLSLNQRKKLARKMYFANKKESLRTINSFFSVMKRIGVITDSVKIKPSKKEQEIVRKRKEYRKLQAQTETARVSYKKEKGDFYKKRLIKLGY